MSAAKKPSTYGAGDWRRDGLGDGECGGGANTESDEKKLIFQSRYTEV